MAQRGTTGQPQNQVAQRGTTGQPQNQVAQSGTAGQPQSKVSAKVDYSQPLPGAKCSFCHVGDENELAFGKMYQLENITTHYYCLLLSSNMDQKGEDDEGVLGFLYPDVLKELKRGTRLVCVYCKKNGATIGCCASRCKKVFHLPCGYNKGSLHQFFGQFKSFCRDHRPTQKIPPKLFQEVSDGDINCPICLDSVDPKSVMSTIWAPCCKKNAWFHRNCLQSLAISAGYFFKCPLCCDNKVFQKAMLDFGVFIPEQDASWERVPDAFQELLQRPNQCDAPECKCPKGRGINDKGTRFELIMCALCGGQASHIYCSHLQWANPQYACDTCFKYADSSNQYHRGDNEGDESEEDEQQKSSEEDEKRSEEGTDASNEGMDVDVENVDEPEPDRREATKAPLPQQPQPLSPVRQSEGSSQQGSVVKPNISSVKLKDPPQPQPVSQGCPPAPPNAALEELIILSDSDDEDVRVIESADAVHGELLAADGSKIPVLRFSMSLNPPSGMQVLGDVKVRREIINVDYSDDDIKIEGFTPGVPGFNNRSVSVRPVKNTPASLDSNQKTVPPKRSINFPQTRPQAPIQAADGRSPQSTVRNRGMRPSGQNVPQTRPLAPSQAADGKSPQPISRARGTQPLGLSVGQTRPQAPNQAADGKSPQSTSRTPGTQPSGQNVGHSYQKSVGTPQQVPIGVHNVVSPNHPQVSRRQISNQGVHRTLSQNLLQSPERSTVQNPPGTAVRELFASQSPGSSVQHSQKEVNQRTWRLPQQNLTQHSEHRPTQQSGQYLSQHSPQNTVSQTNSNPTQYQVMTHQQTQRATVTGRPVQEQQPPPRRRLTSSRYPRPQQFAQNTVTLQPVHQQQNTQRSSQNNVQQAAAGKAEQQSMVLFVEKIIKEQLVAQTSTPNSQQYVRNYSRNAQQVNSTANPGVQSVPNFHSDPNNPQENQRLINQNQHRAARSSTNQNPQFNQSQQQFAGVPATQNSQQRQQQAYNQNIHLQQQQVSGQVGQVASNSQWVQESRVANDYQIQQNMNYPAPQKKARYSVPGTDAQQNATMYNSPGDYLPPTYEEATQYTYTPANPQSLLTFPDGTYLTDTGNLQQGVVTVPSYTTVPDPSGAQQNMAAPQIYGVDPAEQNVVTYASGSSYLQEAVNPKQNVLVHPGMGTLVTVNSTPQTQFYLSTQPHGPAVIQNYINTMPQQCFSSHPSTTWMTPLQVPPGMAVYNVPIIAPAPQPSPRPTVQLTQDLQPTTLPPKLQPTKQSPEVVVLD